MNRIHFVAMKCNAITLVPVIAILASLGLSAQSAEHEHRRAHPRFKLIDLGTLGGPHSYGSTSGDGFRMLNNSGVVASLADTDEPDPNAPNFCFNTDCFMAHAFQWKDGLKTDLGALPGMNSSAAGSINERGWDRGRIAKWRTRSGLLLFWRSASPRCSLEAWSYPRSRHARRRSQPGNLCK